MTHFWVRAEGRPNEERVGVMPAGVQALMSAGHRVTVEDDPTRAIATSEYRTAGAEIAAAEAWRDAPHDAVIVGLKELPDDGTALRHTHVMFGHAYKGQADGPKLLRRFREGGGTLLDLESLVDPSGRRVAAFGVWAGFAGAAMSLFAWAAQKHGTAMAPGRIWSSSVSMADAVRSELGGAAPHVIVIGANGRVGSGAVDLCQKVGAQVTRWDMAETAHGGPFPEVLAHDVFLNCILAMPGVPVFFPRESLGADRTLGVIGDIACDPTSDFNPVPVYGAATSWEAPVVRVHDDPVLDVMAIDNLPSMLPREASEDFAGQLLPHLTAYETDPDGVWARARAEFEAHVSKV